MAAKRHTSAQTRVKLSQAAKKRRRGPKGSIYGGRFMDALHKSGAGRLIEETPNLRETHAINKAEATRRVQANPERAADEIAYGRTLRQTGKISATREELNATSSRVSSRAQREVLMADREKHWDQPGAYRTNMRKPPTQFIKEEMPESHRQVHEQRLKDPNSVFNKDLTPASEKGYGRTKGAQRRREDQYFSFLQQGLSDQEALDRVAAARQGRHKATGPKVTQPTGLDTRNRKTPARKSKFEQAVPRKGELNIGADSQLYEKASALGDRYDLPEANLVQMQEAQKMALSDELFQKNSKWAHETRRSNILGGKEGKGAAPSDRVVLFTTNLGSPNPSVPADSLIGQYVIRKRRNMLSEAGYRKAELRGTFPLAARDKHVVELATGIHWGVEGATGAYRRMGWRRGKQTSKNYMRPVPLGSQILYDSQGRPIYDENGNVRYSEGGTRRFRYETPDLGLRIFIG